MKTRHLLSMIILLFTTSFFSCELADELDKKSDETDLSTTETCDSTFTTSPDALSEEEIAGLKFMREEEKLARDVYAYFYEMYGLSVFSNINNSESKHINAVENLLVYFDGEQQPLPEQGVFTIEALQQLYTDLTAQGSENLLAALAVGAAIEEIDILDLQEYAEATANEDVLQVYANLERGSRNHLRSFVSTITSEGGTYAAQFMEEEEYLAIVNSEIESGNGGNSGGNGRRYRGGR